MKNILLLLQYDGSDFFGWQAQDSGRTVQGVVRDALRTLLKGEEVTLHASSRTDSGVHAIALPVSFKTRSNLPLKAFVFGMNSLLPEDVKVVGARYVPDWFHARFSAISKTYLYKIHCGPVSLPLHRRNSWHVPRILDAQAMKEAATVLVGQHDFSAFRASGCDAYSPVRVIHRCDVIEGEPGSVCVIVTANGFLRNMVRIIVGTLVWVGLEKRPKQWVEEVLALRDRRLAGPTAPAKGLYLVNVQYPEVPDSECFPNARVFSIQELVLFDWLAGCRTRDATDNPFIH